MSGPSETVGLAGSERVDLGEALKRIPKKFSGVYMVWCGDVLAYIGESASVRRRADAIGDPAEPPRRGQCVLCGVLHRTGTEDPVGSLLRPGFRTANVVQAKCYRGCALKDTLLNAIDGERDRGYMEAVFELGGVGLLLRPKRPHLPCVSVRSQYAAVRRGVHLRAREWRSGGHDGRRDGGTRWRVSGGNAGSCTLFMLPPALADAAVRPGRRHRAITEMMVRASTRRHPRRARGGSTARVKRPAASGTPRSTQLNRVKRARYRPRAAGRHLPAAVSTRAPCLFPV